MIELLTPPAAAEPLTPPSAIPSTPSGAIDFAVVFGNAGPPVAAPTAIAPVGEDKAVPAQDAAAPALPTLDAPVAPAAAAPDQTAPAVKLPTLDALPSLPAGFLAQKAAPPSPAASQAEEEADDSESQTTQTANEVFLPAPVLSSVLPPPVSTAAPLAAKPPVEPAAKSVAKSVSAKADVPTMDKPSATVSTSGDPVWVVSLATGSSVAPQSPTDNAASAPAFQAVQNVSPIQPSVPPTPVAPPTVMLDDLMVAGAGDSAWLGRLADDIVTLGSGDAREARLKISPRSLGDMAIKLEMDGRHARVHFTVDTPQALTLMADGAPKLASLVEANGLKLDGATVDLNQHREERSARQQQADQPRFAGRVPTAVARALARTRIVTATERFA